MGEQPTFVWAFEFPEASLERDRSGFDIWLDCTEVDWNIVTDILKRVGMAHYEYLVDGMSLRAIARGLEHARNTMAKAIAKTTMLDVRLLKNEESLVRYTCR